MSIQDVDGAQLPWAPSFQKWPQRRRLLKPRAWMPFDFAPDPAYVAWTLQAFDRASRVQILSIAQKLYIQQRGRCAYCTSYTWAAMPPPINGDIGLMVATLDHITPLGRGGIDAQSNWAMACAHCNNEKGNMLSDEYRDWKQWCADRECVDSQGLGGHGKAVLHPALQEIIQDRVS
jgi:hypothetical protein